MRILVINFTRLGDILQSQAGISDLAEAGHEVALVCLENFMAAATLMRGLSHVFPFPGTSLLRALSHTAQKDDGFSALLPDTPLQWPEGLTRLHTWKAEVLKAFPPDMVINMTPTLAARLLGKLFADAVNMGEGEGFPARLPDSGAPCRLYGYSLDAHGFGVNSDVWTALLQGVRGNRLCSPFNVVDIFRKILTGGLSLHGSGNSALLSPAREECAAMEARLAAQRPEQCQGFVAFQLGASELRRQWPEAYFARLGDALWHKHKICPVLLGTEAEKALVSEYARTAAHPFLSLCGETTIPALGAVLKGAKMLVTNDTGTMHLAAGLGVPVLGIFLATAQPFDTGPYFANTCSVEPDIPCHPCAFGARCPRSDQCRTVIQPETLYDCVRHFLEQGVFPDNSRPMPGARVWRYAKDGQGVAALSSISGHEQTDRALWMRLQQHILYAFMAGEPIPRCRELLSALTPETARAIREECSTIKALLELVTGQGQLLLMRPQAPVRQKFLATWSRVHQTLLESQWFAAFGLLWVHDTQEKQEELAKVLATMTRYKDGLEGVAVALESLLQASEHTSMAERGEG